MTTSKLQGEPRVKATAGGRENWAYDPEQCQVMSAQCNGEGLKVKASAGGYDRGVAILVEIQTSFIIENLPKLLGFHSNNPDGFRFAQKKLSEQKANAARSLWEKIPVEYIFHKSISAKLTKLECKTLGDVISRPRSSFSTKSEKGLRVSSPELAIIDSELRSRGLKFSDEEISTK